MTANVTNGSGDGAATAKVPSKGTDYTKITDPVQVRVIALYLVQKLHEPTLAELSATAKEKLNANIHAATLGRVLSGLSKAGFIAINMKQMDGGTSERVFSMKDMARWRQPPEYAHILDLLPSLLASDAASNMKQWFDQQEGGGPAAGDGSVKNGKGKAMTVKKPRGNVVDDYHSFTVVVRTRSVLLGSQIPCQASHEVKKMSPMASDKNDKGEDVEMQGIFERDALFPGTIVIQPDVLQGWFGSNVGRYGGAADARARYVAFSPVRIKPSRPMLQSVLPVNSDKGRPSAPKSYETLRAGEVFKIRFLAPTKGLFTPAQYEKLFLIAGMRPRRGLSPARGRRYGQFEVMSFIDHGPIGGEIDYLLEDLGLVDDSAELARYAKMQGNPYMIEAVRRLSAVSLTADFSGSSQGFESRPFPISGAFSPDEDDDDAPEDGSNEE